ncbi:MAG: hypothetical protein AAGK14_09150 [Verrucomicrobiota bacterium]
MRELPPFLPRVWDPCPYLPMPHEPMTHETILNLGEDRGPVFYETALKRANWLWMEEQPAKAILLINRAFASSHVPPGTAELVSEEAALSHGRTALDELPYRALAWMLRRAQPEKLPGSCRVHYQHLATRMSGPRRELRAWRAWAAWCYVRRIWPELPADEKQTVTEPTEEEVEVGLAEHGTAAEARLWKHVLESGACARARPSA